MALKRPSPYVGLSVNYADDEKIMDAGEDAELLYIRMLAYAGRTPLTEGWISDRVLASRLGILPRDAYDETGTVTGTVPGTDAGSRAERLREVGLIERDDDGWRIVTWLRWNRSIEEMGKERERDRARKSTATSADTERGREANREPGRESGRETATTPGSKDQDQDQDQDQGPRKRGTRISLNFQPSKNGIVWARADCPNVNIEDATQEFIDYWIAVSGQKGIKLDWEATWRNDMRRKQKWAKEQGAGGQSVSDRLPMVGER